MKYSILTFSLLFSASLSAQPTWKSGLRERVEIENPFGALMTPNFCTTSMLDSRNWHYEISHRFIPEIREKGAFGGLDGGANVRMSLGYGIKDAVNIRIGRSSLHDNIDVQLKFKLWTNKESISNNFAIKLGIARNGDLPGEQQGARIWQYFGQLIYNIQVSSSPLRLGFVPSYLHNTAPYSLKSQNSTIMGVYALYYLKEMFGVWVEAAPLITGYRGRLWPLEPEYQKYNTPFSAGISQETGGHVFYVFATNSLQLNPSQFLAGSPKNSSPKNWHLGFAITRHL